MLKGKGLTIILYTQCVSDYYYYYMSNIKADLNQ